MNVNLDQVRRVGAELGATEKRIEGAIAFATRDAKRAAQAAARALIVDATGLPRVALSRRVNNLRGHSGAWVGTNDVRVSTAYKRPRQAQGGVTVGNRTILGAFVMRTKSGALVVMQRTGKTLRAATIEIHDQVAPRLAARASELERLFVEKFDAEVIRQLRRAG